MNSKHCYTCQSTKPLSEFNKMKASSDGHQSTCRACYKQYKLDHKEKIKQYRLDHKEEIKQYRLDHKEEIKQWCVDHKEEKNQSKKLWRKDNKEKTAVYNANQSRGRVPWRDKDKIAKMYLDCQPGYHVDHIIPINHPLVCGLTVHNNLQILTAQENIAKSNYYEII